MNRLKGQAESAQKDYRLFKELLPLLQRYVLKFDFSHKWTGSAHF